MSTFRLPSAEQRKLLKMWHHQYLLHQHWATGFLTERGIKREWAEKWLLGVKPSATKPSQLVIPYYNNAGLIGLKYRCLQNHDCKAEGHRRYDNPPGQQTYLYNLEALDTPENTIHITEGELDAIVLAESLHVPTVGVPGADAWQSHWIAHFRGFNRIILWGDGDQAGRAMADRWRKRIGVEVVDMPPGEDVSSIYVNQGEAGLRQLFDAETKW